MQILKVCISFLLLLERIPVKTGAKYFCPNGQNILQEGLQISLMSGHNYAEFLVSYAMEEIWIG